MAVMRIDLAAENLSAVAEAPRIDFCLQPVDFAARRRNFDCALRWETLFGGFFNCHIAN